MDKTGFVFGPEDVSRACSTAHFSNWRVFAAAAGATLAMSANANAAIIHTTLDTTLSLTPGQSVITSAVLHFGGATDTAHLRRITSGANYGLARISGNIQFATTGLRSAGPGFEAAKNFAFGSLIGPLVPVTGGGATFLAKHTSSGGNYGAFRGSNGSGFLGFKTGGGDYGWLKVVVSDAGSPTFPNELQVLDYAIDTTGAPIAAGDTGVPEPGTSGLALLALGAAGILAWRHRRKEVA
jgi:PEP-CTERM motif